MFAEDDPFVGIDLDNIRLLNGGIDGEALDSIKSLDSYGEVSPSGHGIKIWVCAHLDRSYKKPGLEIYPHRRYFTVTGQILPQGQATPQERTTEVVDLICREFPAPAKLPQRRTEEYDGPEMDIADYLERVEVFGEVHDNQGTKFAIRCPWADEHSNGVTGTYLGQRTNGAVWFHCNHAHCTGRNWRAFKKKVLPGFRMKITRPGYTGDMEVRYG